MLAGRTCHADRVEPDVAGAVAALRAAGAPFAFLQGSQATGAAGPGSDLDLAAFFGREAAAYDVVVPHGVDLLVLGTALPELAGRVAMHGVLLLDDAPAGRLEREVGFRNLLVHGYAEVDDHRVVAQLQELAGVEEFVTATARLLC